MPILVNNSHPDQLYINGPLVTVEVYQTPALMQLQNGQSSALPQPYIGTFLIDTGATLSCVKPHIAQQLQLKQVGTAQIGTPNSTSSHPVYVAGLKIIVGKETISYDVIRVTETPLHGQKIDGLIGRDILKQKAFHYFGFTGQFFLAV